MKEKENKLLVVLPSKRIGQNLSNFEAQENDKIFKNHGEIESKEDTNNLEKKNIMANPRRTSFTSEVDRSPIELGFGGDRWFYSKYRVQGVASADLWYA